MELMQQALNSENFDALVQIATNESRIPFNQKTSREIELMEEVKQKIVELQQNRQS